MKRTFKVAVLLGLVVGLAGNAWSAPDEQKEKVELATVVLDEIMAIPEQGIPPALLAGSGIAILPNMLKVGVVVGGRYGTGVLLVRDDKGHWSNPVFISLTGGSVGWQLGAQSTDVILVFRSRRNIERLMDGTFTFGGDVGVAAGPVGRRLEGATDATFRSEIYSYSRSRGLFAGVSLEGSSLQIDNAATAAYYKQPGINAVDILKGTAGHETPEIARLRERLNHYATP